MLADEHTAIHGHFLEFLAAERIIERAQAGLRAQGVTPEANSTLPEEPTRMSPKARTAKAKLDDAIEPTLQGFLHHYQLPINDEEWGEASRVLLERAERNGLNIRNESFDRIQALEGQALAPNAIHAIATHEVARALDIELPYVNEAGIEI